MNSKKNLNIYATQKYYLHLIYIKSSIMTTFLIILGALLVTNFLLLQFSCNDANADTEVPEEE